MNEPHDPNVTTDIPLAPAGSLRASDPRGTTDHAHDPRGTIDQVPGPASLVASRPDAPPDTDAPAGGLPAVPGYRVVREIARGGMGCVLAAHDLGLDREVALKILLPGANADRFVRESKITARLPHPGIPPVHALGTLADGSPFLAMKLIAGQTLADEMKTADRPRLLQAFTQVCQAVGFAHSRGVIHRDLKPANVMVGAFGEVQVMDWGLAKDVTSREVADEPRSSEAQTVPIVVTDAHQTTDYRAPGESTDDRTQAGTVLGTPAYMAPEQARGEAADARADVFALGGILCKILTGQPPFVGKSARVVIQRAGAGDLAEAHARLDGCGADAELVALCRRCLSPNPADRPANGQAVADGLTAYLNGVQERLQAAERERAVAVVRATEERRRRKVQLVLAASVLALTTLGGLSTTYYLQQRQARAAAVERVVGQTETLLDQAKAQPEDLSRWQVALAAVEQAEAGGEATAQDRLLALRTEIQAGLDAARRDRTLLERVVDIRSAAADDWDGSATDHDYADAFRAVGIDLASLPPAEAGAKIKARPPSVTLALAAALDDWASTRRGKRKDATGATRLSEAARVADPDPWRIDLRNTLDQPDKAARLTRLQALAKAAKYDELGPVSLHLLGTGLNEAGDSPQAESVLRKAQQRHPRDVWVNYELGSALEKQDRGEEAIRFYTAARAIRPETAHELAHALEKRGDWEEALAVFRDLKGLRPGNPRHLLCLSRALKKDRQPEAGETLDAAVAAGREAVRLKPDSASAHHHLGGALSDKGQVDEAIACFQKAIELDPKLAVAHSNLVNMLKNKGNELAGKGQVNEAIACFQKAIELDPKDATAYNGLGAILCDVKRDYDGAIACFRQAIELDPKLAKAHTNLGAALHERRQVDEAIACFKKAIALDPKLGKTHFNLGNALANKGQLDEAIACFQKAIALDPKDANAHCNLACVLALAAAGGGEKAAKRDDPERTRLRRQALDSLRAALALFAKQLESDKPADRARVQRALLHRQQDTNLAGLRDAAALAKLPADEQKALTQLWADVAALLKKANAPLSLASLLEQLPEARKALPKDSPQLAGLLAQIGLGLLEQKRWTEAEPLLRECLAIREQTQPDVWSTFNTQSLLGGALLGQQKYADAEPLLLAGYEGLKQREKTIPPQGSTRIPEALDRLIELSTATNKPDALKKWQAERAKYPAEAAPPQGEKK